MSFQAMAWAHAQKVPDAECKLLLLILADYANDHEQGKFTCWPSIARLASDCLLCENTIRKRLKQLVECQVLTIIQRVDEEGRNGSHKFVLPVILNHMVHGVNPPPSCREPSHPARREPEPVIREPINEPEAEGAIRELHQEYIRATGLNIALNMDRIRVWYEWLKQGFDKEDINLVVQHRRKIQRDEGILNNMLAFDHLIGQHDKFDQYRAAAKAKVHPEPVNPCY